MREINQRRETQIEEREVLKRVEEFMPGLHQRNGWGYISKEERSRIIEESSMICALCGEYCDSNFVLHHRIYRKGPNGERREAQPDDVVVIHNRPEGFCEGHHKGLRTTTFIG